MHAESGPPPGAASRRDPKCCPSFNGAYGNPALYRPILARHPNLRIWIQHAGAPPGEKGLSYGAQTLALMKDFPNVYVDMSVTQTISPPAKFKALVADYKRRGFLSRVMLGTDNMETAGAAAEHFRALPFLSEDEKRGVLHDNAARFFRIDATGKPAR